MKFILTTILSFIIGAIGVFVVYNFVPLKYFEISSTPKLGSTITTILGTDRLTDSRTTINNNFSNLNTDKWENGSTGTTFTLGTLTLSAGSVGVLTAGNIIATTTATSTYTGGISSAGVASSKGITIASGFGALNSQSTATSSFANGITISGGCILWNSNCLLPLNLTATNIWTGLQTFAYAASSTWSAGIESPVTASAYFIATSTTATSTLTSLRVSGSATTSTMTVSNGCIGCTSPTIVTNTGAMQTTQTNTTSVTATCTGNKKVAGGGFSGIPTSATFQYLLNANYPDSSTSWTTTVYCAGTGCGAGTLTVYAICVNP